MQKSVFSLATSKKILSLNDWYDRKDDTLSDEKMALREMCEDSLYSFMKEAWPWIEGGREFHGGWHIEAIAEHLEQVAKGGIRNLLINIPPRCCKSSLASVVFPAWVWATDPTRQFLYTSYAQSLSVKDSVKCRRLVESPWYQENWGKNFHLTGDVNSKVRFETSRTGYRIASSVGGANTGEGADILVADDPNSARDVDSVKIRESTNDWWDQVMSTRLNNPRTGAKVVVQQRLHELDLSGHILAKADHGYIHLCLPMEMELSRRCRTIPLTKGAKAWVDPRNKEGQLLWPEHIDKKEVSKLKNSMTSSYTIAGQLQQRPSPEDGGIIQKDWFSWWCDDHMPEVEFVLQSWDTALSAEVTACYSACTTWGVFKDEHGINNAILLSCWRGRVEYPDLRRMAQKLGENYHDTYLDDELPTRGPKADIILVEAKANGLSLIQDLRRGGVIVTRFDPGKHGNKISRARLITPIIESGRVWMPAKPPHFNKLYNYADEFVETCALFPNAESNDYVDSMSQALIKLISSGWIHHPEDDVPIDYGVDTNMQKPLYEI